MVRLASGSPLARITEDLDAIEVYYYYLFIPRAEVWTYQSLVYLSRDVSIVGSLRDREVACSASDRQGSNFESCVWRTVSSQSSHHPQEVFLAQFSLYVHKGGLKPDSFHFVSRCNTFFLKGEIKKTFPNTFQFSSLHCNKIISYYVCSVNVN